MPNMKWFCFVYLFQIVVNVEAFSTRRNWDYRICFHWFHIYNRQMKSSESIKRKWPWCMLRILYCYSTPSFRGKEHLWDWWMTIFLKRKHKCWSKPLLLTLVYKTALFLYNFQKKSVFTLAVSSEIEYLSTPGIVEGTVYVLLHERRKFDRLQFKISSPSYKSVKGERKKRKKTTTLPVSIFSYLRIEEKAKHFIWRQRSLDMHLGYTYES